VTGRNVAQKQRQRSRTVGQHREGRQKHWVMVLRGTNMQHSGRDSRQQTADRQTDRPTDRQDRVERRDEAGILYLLELAM
jgi:hypothetical protein